MSDPHEELVYVVPRDRLMPGGTGWRGVREGPLEEELRILRTAGVLRPRAAMERDPTYKQVIPYLVLRDGPRYFLMRRTRAGADERLHERFSIGVGGHLNDVDIDARGADLEAGLRREWHEELVADFDPDFRLVGLLNDDDTEVGSVHVGLVYEAETGGRPVAVRETHKLTGRMADPDEVARTVDRMETWSALVFEFLETRAGVAR